MAQDFLHPHRFGFDTASPAAWEPLFCVFVWIDSQFSSGSSATDQVIGPTTLLRLCEPSRRVSLAHVRVSLVEQRVSGDLLLETFAGSAMILNPED